MNNVSPVLIFRQNPGMEESSAKSMAPPLESALSLGTADEPGSRDAENHPPSVILREAAKRLGAGSEYCRATGMPLVTVSYAQSIDGSIASRERKPLPLSSSESLTVTHALRSMHDAVLVGIGCVLADNPRLTVRLTSGRNPQPVVVDSVLRCPISANLLRNGSRPWIGCTHRAPGDRRRLLEDSGARVIRCKGTSSKRVDLRALLLSLSDLGINSVMVEGGSKIITSFLAEHLVNQFVITVAPLFVGGLKAIDRSDEVVAPRLPRLVHASYERVGDDLMLLGDPSWAGQ